jgi:metacaspase-1
MATGMSIHVGVNDTQAPGVSASLVGCDEDARRMFKLARDRGFVGVNDGDDDVPILGGNATRDKVLAKILIAAEKLQAGDIFLFTFSGHGTRRGQEDDVEVDENDETLVMQDRFLVDNVLQKLVWPSFKEGVRVVMVSDSCHSGGVAMSLVRSEDDSSNGSSSVVTEAVPTMRNVQRGPRGNFRIRTISEIENQTHFELLKEFYAKVRSDLPQVAPLIKANILLLAACREHETTKDGDPNGVFTRELLKAFNSNGSKTYRQLMSEIAVNLEAAGEPSHPVLRPIPDIQTFADTEAFRI